MLSRTQSLTLLVIGGLIALGRIAWLIATGNMTGLSAWVIAALVLGVLGIRAYFRRRS